MAFGKLIARVRENYVEGDVFRRHCGKCGCVTTHRITSTRGHSKCEPCSMPIVKAKKKKGKK